MMRMLFTVICLTPALSALGDVTTDDSVGPSVVQTAIVKVYGLGGVAGLEGYQTGLFIEPSGAVVTIDSTVLESGVVTLVDAYGDRYEGRVVGRDAESGLSLLACPESVTPPGVLSPEVTQAPRRGEAVWALSNAFAIASGDEPVTAQRGRIAAISPMPSTLVAGRERAAAGVPRSGAKVLLLDAVTSNPGAGGGAVVGRDGVLRGVLGAECRSPVTGSWINYAVPVSTLREAIARMRSQREEAISTPAERGALDRARLRELGIVLIPTVTRRSPPFVERVTAKSVAHQAGLRSDDLIIEVDGVAVGVGDQAASAIVERVGDADVAIRVLRDQRVVTLILSRVAP